MNKFFYQTILVLVFFLGANCNKDDKNQGSNPPDNNSPVIVGALRWDAWHKPVDYEVHGIYGGPVKAMERSLSQKQYQSRAPFFSKIISESEIQIGGYTQEILDQEIDYAHNSGLDYWAFLLYQQSDVMSEGLRYYLSSTKKQNMKFCAMAQSYNLLDERNRLVSLIKEPSYQMVFGNRPLIYIYGLSNGTSVRLAVDNLRNNVIDEGFGDPYIVVMHEDENIAKTIMNELGGNAISRYAIWGNGGDNSPYSSLTASASITWNNYRRKGVEVVPTVTSGWNRSPRIENPVPWEPWQVTGENANKIFELPTTQELTKHVQEGIDWVELNKETTCPAKVVLIYAWNEHDEGGWLCPTITESGGIDNSRLEALKSVLND